MKIAYIVNGMDMGGIETFLMNVIEKIYKKHSITIYTYRTDQFDYDEKLLKLGVVVKKIGQNTPKRYMLLYKEFKRNKYDIIHCNTHFDAAFVLLAAKIAGVKKRISHSHNAGIRVTFKRKILSKAINAFATTKLACGDEAGKKYYGNNDFIIINNGISINRFKYSRKNRYKIRSELNIDDDSLVIGHIGRFEYQKNHEKIIEIFHELHKINPKTYLVLVGSGSLENKIKEIVHEKGLGKNVLFLGKRNDVCDIYSVFDALVFPSRFEGLPLTLIEAQTNGLPIIASDKIDPSVNITGEITFLDINDSNRKWSSTILNSIGKRYNKYCGIEKSEYCINNVIKRIEDIYEQ